MAATMFYYSLLIIALMSCINCQGNLLTQLPPGLTSGATSNQPGFSATSTATTNSTLSASTTSTATATTPSGTITVVAEDAMSTITAAQEDIVSIETTVPVVSAEDNTYVWQDGVRVMVGSCFDIQPPNAQTCQQQKQLGKCARTWMLEGGLCAKTCGYCEDECIDIQPSLDFTCAQEVARDTCNQIGDEYCRLTCGRCAAPVPTVPQTPVSPKAEVEPTPTPTPMPTSTPVVAPTPSAECSCPQCEEIGMDQILVLVEQAVRNVLQQILQ
eukprot:TRINITY_DN1824_c0_g1_i3.p1 TRINITY_DN1824_c0_g1~~TRINITY_DN1824_c0_g1_i3.p1  ORF type:complete len:271 (-),score=54.88 TRINITY_DN1824_c0_g1_i3:1598-2410(-)